MIELYNFSKRYRSVPAVRDFSMVCRKGEVTGLLGLNGAGKTTILKAVCARHIADSGTVHVENHDATEETELVRNLTGFVTEEPVLPDEYTVREFLNGVKSLHHGAGAKPAGRPGVFLDMLDIGSLADKKIRTLSKGQRERVNFAQAVLYDPPVLVLDEPASGLDPAQIAGVRRLVQALKKDHTILLSTHLMQEVSALCDVVYILHEGRCAASGTPEEIAAKSGGGSFERAFFRITGGEREP